MGRRKKDVSNLKITSAYKNLQWSNRRNFNICIRHLASVTGVPSGKMWYSLYEELKRRHGIYLDNRNDGHKPWIENIQKDEWDKVMQSFVSICKTYKI